MELNRNFYLVDYDSYPEVNRVIGELFGRPLDDFNERAELFLQRILDIVEMRNRHHHFYVEHVSIKIYSTKLVSFELYGRDALFKDHLMSSVDKLDDLSLDLLNKVIACTQTFKHKRAVFSFNAKV